MRSHPPTRAARRQKARHLKAPVKALKPSIRRGTEPTLCVHGYVLPAGLALAAEAARAVHEGTAYLHHVHLHYRSLPFPAARAVLTRSQQPAQVTKYFKDATRALKPVARKGTEPTLCIHGYVLPAGLALAAEAARVVHEGLAYRHHVYLHYRSLPYPAARSDFSHSHYWPTGTEHLTHPTHALKSGGRKGTEPAICVHGYLLPAGLALAAEAARAVHEGRAYRHHVHLHYHSLPYPAARTHFTLPQSVTSATKSTKAPTRALKPIIRRGTEPTLCIHGHVLPAGLALAAEAARAVHEGHAYRHHVRLHYRSLPYPAARSDSMLPAVTVHRIPNHLVCLFATQKEQMSRRLAQICALAVQRGFAYTHHVCLVHSIYPHFARTIGMTCAAVDRFAQLQHPDHRAELSDLAHKAAAAVDLGAPFRRAPQVVRPGPVAGPGSTRGLERSLRKAHILRIIAWACRNAIRGGAPFRHHVHLVHHSLPWPSARATDPKPAGNAEKRKTLKKIARNCAVFITRKYPMHHVRLYPTGFPYSSLRAAPPESISQAKFRLLRNLAYECASFIHHGVRMRHPNLVYRSLPYPSARVQTVTMVPRRKFLILRQLAYAAAAFVRFGGRLNHVTLVYHSLPHPVARVASVVSVSHEKLAILRKLAYAAAVTVLFGKKMNHVKLVYRSLPWPRARVEPDHYLMRHKFVVLRSLAKASQHFVRNGHLHHVDLVYTSLPYPSARAVVHQPQSLESFVQLSANIRHRHVLQILAAQCAAMVAAGIAYKNHVALVSQRWSSTRRTLSEVIHHALNPETTNVFAVHPPRTVDYSQRSFAPIYCPEAALIARTCAAQVNRGTAYKNHITLVKSRLPFNSEHAVSSLKITAPLPHLTHHLTASRQYVLSTIPFLA